MIVSHRWHIVESPAHGERHHHVGPGLCLALLLDRVDAGGELHVFEDNVRDAVPLGVFLLGFRDIARVGDHGVLVSFLGAGVGGQPAAWEAAAGAHLVEVVA